MFGCKKTEKILFGKLSLKLPIENSERVSSLSSICIGPAVSLNPRKIYSSRVPGFHDVRPRVTMSHFGRRRCQCFIGVSMIAIFLSANALV